MPDEDPTPFRLVVQTAGDVTTIWVSGELEFATASRLEEQIELARAADRSMVLDLSEVTFIDSTGLQALVRATTVGHGLVMMNPARAVIRLLEITGMLNAFTIRHTD